ncbi:MSCRAMM family protein [Sinomonas sp. P10A9]|uniref:Collagen binding domain-containing protein n=1 Tax=Sinomonas puerhi TaxID=3238584 RepID=A0AB39L5G0_9MICC
MKLIHRSRWAAALGVSILVAAGVTSAQAVTTTYIDPNHFNAVNGSLSTTTAGEIDWTTTSLGVNCNDASFTHWCRDDVKSGKTDDSFGNGTKEDTITPSVTSGAIPPNKSDLTRFFAKVQTESDGNDYAYLAWERQNNPSGTTNMDFELNQAKVDPAVGNGVTPARTVGDILMDFHLASGGTNPQIIWYKWTDGTLIDPTTKVALLCEASNTYPCWGAGTTIGNSSGQSQNFEASVNTTAGQASDPFVGTVLNPAPGALDPFTFGETVVNLEGAGIIQANSCLALNSAYLKSRSSDSFTSEIKDFIQPINLGFQKCGTIKIQKTSIGGTGTFNYTDSTGVAQAPNSTLKSPFSITTTQAGTAAPTDGSTTFQNLRGGTYTFTEGATTGFDATNLTCSSSGTNSTVAKTGYTVAAITLAAGETVTCTYENTARANLHVTKVTNPNPDNTGTSFTFTQTGSPNQSLKNGQTFDQLNLTPGTYTWTESATAGWDLTKVSCDKPAGSGSVSTSTATFTLGAGDNVTCTFTNTERGKVNVHKQDDTGAALAGAVFQLLSGTTVVQTSSPTDASGNYTFTNVVPGAYTVHESTIPSGYAGATDQTVTVAPGAGVDGNVPAVTLTFVDNRQFTIIVLVCKDADHSLYGSTVTVDTVNKTSLAAGGGGAISDASLCALGGATYSPKGTGDHTANVRIQ